MAHYYVQLTSIAGTTFMTNTLITSTNRTLGYDYTTSAVLIECNLFYRIVQRASCYAQSNYHCCLTLGQGNHQSYRGPLSYLRALRCHANVTAYDVLLNKMCAYSDDVSTFHSKNARVYEVLFIARRHAKNVHAPV